MGWALRTAVIGEGVATFGVAKRAGGREKSFCRDTVPSRRVGRLNCDGSSLLNLGPGKEFKERKRCERVYGPAKSPLRRLASSSPSKRFESRSTFASSIDS